MSQAKPSWASLLQPPRPRASAAAGAACSEPPDGGASNRSSAADPPEEIKAKAHVNNNSSAAASSAAVQSPVSLSTTTTPPRRVAMISGHIDLSPEEFARSYHAQLDAALEKGDAFLMGDAKGADELALAYLLTKDPSAAAAGRITVYASRPANVARLEQMGIKVILSEMTDEGRDRGQGRGRGQQQGGARRGGRRGREHHLRRDATMTANSDYDILWVRTEAESRALYGDKYRPRVSATELNRQRRAEVLARQ